MRLAWVATAVAFAILTLKYRRDKYNIDFEEKYYDGNIVIARMVLTPIEYAALGVLETVSRIYTTSRVNEKVKQGRMALANPWGRIAWISYLLALIVFTFRNFILSFWFGLYSVILADEDSGNANRNVLIVLQIYLAIMRGKFFQFYFRLFLGNYFFEDDDEQFDVQAKKRAAAHHNNDEYITPADVDEEEREEDKYAQWFDNTDDENADNKLEKVHLKV